MTDRGGGLERIRAYVRRSERLATSGQPEERDFAAIAGAGFEVVVNLAPPKPEYEREALLVTRTGMSYVQIPVAWDAPRLDDVERFFRVLDAFRDRKVWVHCIANKRVSAFLYLHAVLREGADEATARRVMLDVWEPDGVWSAFIEQVLRRGSA